MSRSRTYNPRDLTCKKSTKSNLGWAYEGIWNAKGKRWAKAKRNRKDRRDRKALDASDLQDWEGFSDQPEQIDPCIADWLWYSEGEEYPDEPSHRECEDDSWYEGLNYDDDFWYDDGYRLPNYYTNREAAFDAMDEINREIAAYNDQYFYEEQKEMKMAFKGEWKHYLVEDDEELFTPEQQDKLLPTLSEWHHRKVA